MVMTDEQKYNEVLKALGEVLAENSVTISTQSWQIDQLKEKLAAAEKERAEAEKEEAKLTFAIRSLYGINDAIRDSIDFEAGVVMDKKMLLDLQPAIRALLELDIEKGGAA